MYSVNGIDLQSSEFELLKDLVKACEEKKALLPFLDKKAKQNPLINETVFGLVAAGLLKGIRYPDGSFVTLEMKQAGIDFVHDYYSLKEQEEADIKQNRRHDYKVASYGAIAGGLLGLFSGALGGYVVDVITALF